MARAGRDQEVRDLRAHDARVRTLAALERATANGYPNAWTAKYHLDLLGMVERAVL